MSDPEQSTFRKFRTEFILLIVGFVVAFFPLALAFFSTAPGHNWMSEGDSQSGGSYIWAMLVSLPIGFVIGLVGFIRIIIKLVAPKNAVIKSTAWARVAGISMIVLGGVFAMMWLPMLLSIFGGAMFVVGVAVVVVGFRLLSRKRN